MNEENNNQPVTKQTENIVPLAPSSSETAVQLSESTLPKEQQGQQAQPPLLQPATQSSPVQPTSSVGQEQQNQQSSATPNLAGAYPESSSGQMQTVMSASQMGYNQPKSKINLNPKLIIKGLLGIAVLAGVFSVLVFTNIISLRKFKNIEYTSLKGTKYRLDFYAKHITKQNKSGSTQLVSKVSRDGKFPIVLLISTGDSSELNKNGIKTCSGALPKALDVQNNNINQTISVCYMPTQRAGDPVGVYVAGFEYNNQAHIVTISQDLEGVDLSSQGAAKGSLAKFGIESYKPDIERIVSSIKVE